VDEASDILKLGPYLDRKPKAMSGGQRQRVAIGRAIVRGPEVFLFDEPLSNLDAELRVEMRVEIARLHQEIGATMIYVTHDQVEAMTMADKIVVLRDGRIEQVGAPLELYRNPVNKFVAGFIGSPSMNFLNCDVVDGALVHPAFDAPLPVETDLPTGVSKVTMGIRSEHITVDRTGDTLSVELTEALGGVSYSYLKASNGDRLIVEERDDERSVTGDTVGLSLRLEKVMLFDPETDQRI
jgi:lactose/L-arabinose transport system ATP-binding protein